MLPSCPPQCKPNDGFARGGHRARRAPSALTALRGGAPTLLHSLAKPTALCLLPPEQQLACRAGLRSRASRNRLASVFTAMEAALLRRCTAVPKVEAGACLVEREAVLKKLAKNFVAGAGVVPIPVER